MSTTDTTAGARKRRNAAGARALTAHRYARGLKVRELAAALGVKPSTVYAWEQGNARPEPATYARLLDVLQLEGPALWLDEDLEVAQ